MKGRRRAGALPRPSGTADRAKDRWSRQNRCAIIDRSRKRSARSRLRQTRTGGRTMANFQLVSDFRPMGDQPEAIERLVEGLKANHRHQTLLGATGTGKTFVMGQVV